MTVLSSEHNRILFAEGERRSALVGRDIQSVWQAGFGGIFSQPVFWWFDQFYARNNSVTLLAAGTRLEIAKTDLLFAERKLISFKLQLVREGARYTEDRDKIRFHVNEKIIDIETEIWQGYALARQMNITVKEPFQNF